MVFEIYSLNLDTIKSKWNQFDDYMDLGGANWFPSTEELQKPKYKPSEWQQNPNQGISKTNTRGKFDLPLLEAILGMMSKDKK